MALPITPRTTQFLFDVADVYNEAGYLTVAFGTRVFDVLSLASASVSKTIGDDISAIANSPEPLCVFVMDWDRFDECREAIKAQRRQPNDVFVRWFPYLEVTR